jgi:hypothetical protein
MNIQQGIGFPYENQLRKSDKEAMKMNCGKVTIGVVFANSEAQFLQNAVRAALRAYREYQAAVMGSDGGQLPDNLSDADASSSAIRREGSPIIVLSHAG